MFKKNIDEAAKRLTEEQLYSAVADELKNKVIREGLMAKALVEASGDKEQARLIYMQYRIQSMLDEAAIKETEQREQTKQRRRLELEREIQQQGKAIGNEIGRFFQILQVVVGGGVIIFIILTLGKFFWETINR